MQKNRPIRFAFAASFAAFVVLAAPARLRAQGKIEGQVTNGTTQRPLAGATVIVLSPRQSMQQVAEATTDARGHFAIPPDGIDPGAFYLLQANYQDVPYHSPAQFDSSGTAKVTITVYDSTHSAKAIRVSSLRVLVAAQGDKARVQEEYQLENSSRPGRAYANDNGTFVFHLPAQANEPKVTVTGLMNMPIPLTPEKGQSPGEFKIRYAMKPGATPVTVAYDVDYSAAQFSFSDSVPFPIDHAEMLVLPASLQVDSTIFKSAGADTANNIQKWTADNIPRGATLDARLSGQGATGANPASEDDSNEGTVKPAPNNMTRLGIPLFVCFLLVLLWVLGVSVAKEWSKLKERSASAPARKELKAKAEALLNSLADLDELFAGGKIEKKQYWKERLELKAKVTAILRKGPPSRSETYATRRNSL